jgi:glycoside/pentoside/hexuronide:cation symporter, GPH family
METIKSSLKEKLLYATGNMGSYILWAFTGVYVTIYVTECLKPDDSFITLLGTIILICRLFDAASDIGMGLLVEKTHSSLGKGRFWFGISIIPLIIVFFFMFFLSGADKNQSIIFISILYFLFTVIFYTMNNIGFNAMLPRLSNDSYDQSNICTINSIFTSVGSLVTSIAIPVFNFLGGESSQKSWTIFVLVLSLLALAGQAVCFFNVKEKPEIVVAEAKHQSKEELKEGMKALFKTKYFYIAILMFTINYYMSLSISSIGKYYSQFVLNNENYYSLFGSLPMVTMGIGLVLTPLLVKKIGKRKTLMLAIAFVVFGNIIGSMYYWSFGTALTAAIIKGFGLAVVMSQLFTLAPDLVAYVEAEKGIRVEGLAASANSFGCKIGSGLGTAIVLWSLPLCGYVKGQATQGASAQIAFTALYWWVPCVLSIVMLILASLWDIDKKTNKLLADKAAAPEKPVSDEKDAVQKAD